MPEHSATIVTWFIDQPTPISTPPGMVENGLRIVAESAARNRLLHGTWIVTTTTELGIHEVWHVPATKDATP